MCGVVGQVLRRHRIKVVQAVASWIRRTGYVPLASAFSTLTFHDTQRLDVSSFDPGAFPTRVRESYYALPNKSVNTTELHSPQWMPSVHLRSDQRLVFVCQRHWCSLALDIMFPPVKFGARVALAVLYHLPPVSCLRWDDNIRQLMISPSFPAHIIRRQPTHHIITPSKFKFLRAPERSLSKYVHHSTINSIRLIHTKLSSMRLINVEAFLKREKVMGKGGQVDCRSKVLECRDDTATAYAILSHRWIDPTEVDYEEMVDLAKMERADQDEVRRRRGYRKIWDTCRQAKKDGYQWVWVDTGCIDKRSSAELSEAINSMHHWYGNSSVCYAYLHDISGPSFPTKCDENRYPNFNGWPE